MFRRILALLFLGVSIVCRAGSAHMPVITALGNTTPYRSLQQAAFRGLAAANQHTGMEYGGIVYRIGDRFYHTVPISSHYPDMLSFSIRIVPDAKIVALFHTHPAGGIDGGRGDNFSHTDVITAQRLHVPSYIVVQSLHEVRVFVPGRDPVTIERYPGDPIREWASGRMVGTVSEVREDCGLKP